MKPVLRRLCFLTTLLTGALLISGLVAPLAGAEIAYVANQGNLSSHKFGGVAAIDTTTNQMVEVPSADKQIRVGLQPSAIAVTPDGRFAYVAAEGDEDEIGSGVSVIDTATHRPIDVPDANGNKGNKLIPLGSGRKPKGIAITPDGKFAYVTDFSSNAVSVIDTATNQAIEVPDGDKLIKVGLRPRWIAITPDGRFAYVVNEGSNAVSVIDTATNQAIEVPDGNKLIKVGNRPRWIAITPDGRFAYVTDEGSGAVSVIDTATNEVVAVPDGNKLIKVGIRPKGIAITPDGRFAYVAVESDDASGLGGVAVIDAATNQAIEVPDGNKLIKAVTSPSSIAIAPNGRFAYVGSPNGVSVIDTATNQAVEVPDGNKLIRPQNQPSGIAITPDSRFAYVAGGSGVVVVDAATNQMIEVPDSENLIRPTRAPEPQAIALTPDGRFAYVADVGARGVSLIDTTTDRAIEVPDGDKLIKVGLRPRWIAITPDGRFAYVAGRASGPGSPQGVSVIDTSTNQAVEVPGGGKLIDLGFEPKGIAVTPDGRFAYVAGRTLLGLPGRVAVIDTATNQVNKLITPGVEPSAVAVTPDGRFAYVVNEGTAGDLGGVTVIDTATNEVKRVPGDNGPSEQISVGKAPKSIAITPDGKFAYVTDFSSNAISVIDTSTNQTIETPDGDKLIKLGTTGPWGIAITGDGRFAYVADFAAERVSVIDTATNLTVEVPDGEKRIRGGGELLGIAIGPDLRPKPAPPPLPPPPLPSGPRAPVASFTAPRARPGVPFSFDASASKDPDSAIAAYAWNFGDGGAATVPAATTTHTYAKPGTYKVSLRATDAAGAASPQLTKTITVAYPGVTVRCPRSAGPKGCAFTLQAIARRPRRGKRAKVESPPARARGKAGRSAVVSLRPMRRYAPALSRAGRILVKEVIRAGGTTRTRFAELRVVR